MNLLLCTFVQQEYSISEAKAVANAIDDIFSPLNNSGWSSAGVYCFWDPNTKEILYIGLATDLALRFKQHNKLITFDSNGCKSRQITDYFATNKQIGYSILAQSAYSQPSCKRFNVRNCINDNEAQEQYGKLLKYGYEAIVNTEGLFIEAHKLATGRKPSWNKIGGSKLGSESATKEHMKLLKMFNSELDDWMVARRSILEISSNPIFEAREHYLHGIRLYAILHQLQFKEAINKWHTLDMVKGDSYLEHIRDDILSNNYI